MTNLICELQATYFLMTAFTAPADCALQAGLIIRRETSTRIADPCVISRTPDE